MHLSNYEKIEANVKDVRFGLINIYMHKHDNDDLIMEKQRISFCLEDHEFNCLQAEQRMKLQHDSLLKMKGTFRDDETWTVKSYFEYPNEDLFDRQEELVNAVESMKFLTQILEVLTYLQEFGYVHGDIRPEYLFYDVRQDRYILLDRLGDPTNFTESQRNSLIYEDKILFMSPEMFLQLAKGQEEISHHPFKSECFSIGMVLLSMYVDENDLIMCYNRHEMKFDSVYFEIISEDLKKNFFIGTIEEMISNFLFSHVLKINQDKRLSPRKTLKLLSDKIAPKILGELENRRVKMGWDRMQNIDTIKEEEQPHSMDNYISSDEVLVSFQGSQVEGVDEKDGKNSDLNAIDEEGEIEIKVELNENEAESLKEIVVEKHEDDEFMDMFGSLEKIKRISLGKHDDEESGFSDNNENMRYTFESDVGLESSNKNIEHLKKSHENPKKEIEIDLIIEKDNSNLNGKFLDF